MLTASTPGLTAHGSAINDKDGYVNDLRVLRHVAKIERVEKSKDDSGCEEHAPYILLRIGSASTIKIDTVYGYVSIYPILRHIELLCTSDLPSLKASVRDWFKKPVCAAIAANLMRRDRGSGRFDRTEDRITEFFIHPVFVLGNVDVGASTRLWLASVAAFTLSYHQITKAFDQTPRDFARIDEHIASLTRRVQVLHSSRGVRKLVDSVLATVKSPYGETDWRAVAAGAVSRLALLARCDLVVLQHIKRVTEAQAEEEGEVKSKGRHGSRKDKTVPTDSMTLDINPEQLKFLEKIAETKGDLWIQSSAHAYTLSDDQSGAIVVFPSGHLYSVTGAPGASAQSLLRDRTALARFESIVPYLPYELSCYAGDINRLGSLEAVHRGRKAGSAPTKGDLETAKAAVAAQMILYSNAIIVSPILFSLMRDSTKKKSVSAPSEAEVEPPAPVVVKAKPAPVPTPVVDEPAEVDEEDEEAAEEGEEEAESPDADDE